jgi:hypothetical protein
MSLNLIEFEHDRADLINYQNEADCGTRTRDLCFTKDPVNTDFSQEIPRESADSSSHLADNLAEKSINERLSNLESMLLQLLKNQSSASKPCPEQKQ